MEFRATPFLIPCAMMTLSQGCFCCVSFLWLWHCPIRAASLCANSRIFYMCHIPGYLPSPRLLQRCVSSFFLYYRRAFSSRFSSIFIPDTISEARLYSIPNTISSLFILPCSRAIFFSKACCICLSIRYFLITKRIYNG